MKLRRGKERVLVIPDLQIPYEHKDALAFMQAVAEEIDPSYVICIGDEVDQLALGRWDTDPEGQMSGPELRKSLNKLQKWYESFPEARVATSNHTGRVQKAAFRAGIAEAYMKPVEEWMEAPPGWSWHDNIVIEGVRYEHGDAQGGMYAARNIAVRNRCSSVIGHHHSHGGVYYVANDSEMIFGMNVGCLIDHKSIAFKYARLSAFKPTLGCGVVIEGVPFFVPMFLTKAGRWTGELVL